MKLFKLIGWGQPAVGCVISREGMGEGGGLYYCNMVVVGGNSLLAGEGAFLQAKVETRFFNLDLGNACHSESCRQVSWEEEEAVFGSQLV